jgi:hypothetical protein
VTALDLRCKDLNNSPLERHDFHTLHMAGHAPQRRYSTKSVRSSTRGSSRAQSGHRGRARRFRRRSTFTIRTGSDTRGISAMVTWILGVWAADARRLRGRESWASSTFRVVAYGRDFETRHRFDRCKQFTWDPKISRRVWTHHLRGGHERQGTGQRERAGRSGTFCSDGERPAARQDSILAVTCNHLAHGKGRCQSRRTGSICHSGRITF